MAAQGTKRRLGRRGWALALGVTLALGVGAGLWLGRGARSAYAATVVLYKSPTCTCCEKWAEHMTRRGFEVERRVVRNLTAIKKEYGIGYRLESCHTAVVEGYALEGHVPAEAVERLLEERPAITGLAVPGMPIGAPGMEGRVREPFTVFAFGPEGAVSAFAQHR